MTLQRVKILTLIFQDLLCFGQSQSFPSTLSRFRQSLLAVIVKHSPTWHPDAVQVIKKADTPQTMAKLDMVAV